VPKHILLTCYYSRRVSFAVKNVIFIALQWTIIDYFITQTVRPLNIWWDGDFKYDDIKTSNGRNSYEII